MCRLVRGQQPPRLRHQRRTPPLRRLLHLRDRLRCTCPRPLRGYRRLWLWSPWRRLGPEYSLGTGRPPARRRFPVNPPSGSFLYKNWPVPLTYALRMDPRGGGWIRYLPRVWGWFQRGWGSADGGLVLWPRSARPPALLPCGATGHQGRDTQHTRTFHGLVLCRPGKCDLLSICDYF